ARAVLADRERVDLEVARRELALALVARVEHVQVAEAAELGQQHDVPAVAEVPRLDHARRVRAAVVQEAVDAPRRRRDRARVLRAALRPGLGDVPALRGFRAACGLLRAVALLRRRRLLGE